MNMSTLIPVNSRTNEFANLIWEVIGSSIGEERILPSGVVEIVFNLSNPISAILPGDKNYVHAPDCFIQGIHTHIVRVNYTGQQHLFGIRLKPFAVRNLLGVIPSEFKNQSVDLTLIDPRFRSLWHQLAEVHSFQERVELVHEFFEVSEYFQCLRSQKLSNWFDHFGPVINDQYKPDVGDRDFFTFETVSSLANKVSFSQRHLSRKAKELFGLNAEELIRYKKFLRVVELIHRGSYSLTEISYLAGFHDQSHFIRVFKSFTGMTPRIYRQNKSQLPFHLFSTPGAVA
jgi:AraC-like DNA-binding protein